VANDLANSTVLINRKSYPNRFRIDLRCCGAGAQRRIGGIQATLGLVTATVRRTIDVIIAIHILRQAAIDHTACVLHAALRIGAVQIIITQRVIERE
jgi:hypothetical protein